jgi:hypothetical protein
VFGFFLGPQARLSSRKDRRNLSSTFQFLLPKNGKND